jgi:hypothetical protein
MEKSVEFQLLRITVAFPPHFRRATNPNTDVTSSAGAMVHYRDVDLAARELARSS